MAGLSDRRVVARDLGREAVQITTTGEYTSWSGKRVSLAAEGARAIAKSRHVHFSEDIVEIAKPLVMASRIQDTTLTVVDKGTLESARELSRTGGCVGIMNFASALLPGGNFLDGALAQEESIARSSWLFPCLNKFANIPETFYSVNRRFGALYSSCCIVTPEMPVFRTDDLPGQLLDEPYFVTVFTIPAPVNRDPSLTSPDEREKALKDRVDRVLSLAVVEGCTHLVLGAFGCGAFRNDNKTVSKVFAELLEDKYMGCFAHVEFAIRCFRDERTDRNGNFAVFSHALQKFI